MTSLVVRSIHLYLPGVYEDQMVVDFECGCWAGSRSESFGYDCPLHVPQSPPSDATPPVLPTGNSAGSGEETP